MSVDFAGLNVSRETLDALEHFNALVLKWTRSINLVAASTEGSIWHRHIVDSAQLIRFAPRNYANWVDIGSGGGFPGVVIATLAKHSGHDAEFTLIESDKRKCTFLRTAVRELALNVDVIADRIENVAPKDADVVSARALADLETLLPQIARHMAPSGIALLHKGRRFSQEIAQARKSWSFDLEEHASLTDPDARLLAIQRISRD